MAVIRKVKDNSIKKLSQNMPERLKKLITDIVIAFMAKINVPQEEIIGIVDRIKERGGRKCSR